MGTTEARTRDPAATPVLMGWVSILVWFQAGKTYPTMDTLKRWHRDRPLPISRESERAQPLILVADLEEWIRQGRRQKRGGR